MVYSVQKNSKHHNWSYYIPKVQRLFLFMGKRTNELCYVSKARRYKTLGFAHLKNSSRMSCLLKNNRIFHVYFKFLFWLLDSKLINLPIICGICTVQVFWNWERIGHMTLKENLLPFRRRHHKEKYGDVFLASFICFLKGSGSD